MVLDIIDILPNIMAGQKVRAQILIDVTNKTIAELAELAKGGAVFVIDDEPASEPVKEAEPVAVQEDDDMIIDLSVEKYNETDTLVKDMFLRGRKPEAIAQGLGLSRSGVYAKLKRMGLK